MKALVANDGLSATTQPIPREAEVLGTPSGVFSAFFWLDSSAAALAGLDSYDLAGGDAPGTNASNTPLTETEEKPQSPVRGTAPRPADLGERSHTTASRFAALADEQDIAASAYAEHLEGNTITATPKLAFPEVEPADGDATVGIEMPTPIFASIPSLTNTPVRNRADGEATQALVAVEPSHTGQTASLDPLTTQSVAPVAASGPEAFADTAAHDALTDDHQSLPSLRNGKVAKPIASMPPQRTSAAITIGAATDGQPDTPPATVATLQRSAATFERAPRPYAEVANKNTRRIPATNPLAPQTSQTPQTPQTPAHLPARPAMEASPPAVSDGAISALQNGAAPGAEVRAFAIKSVAPMAAPPNGLNTAHVSETNTPLRGLSLPADAAPFTGLLARGHGYVSPESAAAGSPAHPFAAQRSVASVSSAAEAEPKAAKRSVTREAGARSEVSIRAATLNTAAVPTATPVLDKAPVQRPDGVAAINPARVAPLEISATSQTSEDRAQAISYGASAAPQAPQTAREVLFSLDDAGVNDPEPQTDIAQPSFLRSAYERVPIGGAHMAAVQTAEQGAAVVRQIAESAARGIGHSVELTLAPEELGRVRLTLATTDQGVTVSVQADRPETLDLIRRNIEHLARDFRDLGYSAINFNFGEKPQDRGQPTPQGPLGEPNGEDPHSRPKPAPRATAPRPVTSGGLDLRL